MQVPPITSRYAFATTNHPANPVQLIDIGANLTHDSFDHDRDAVLQRAREAGVVQMVVTGASREHSPQALELARAHPGELFATAGVHPHHATEYTAECDVEMRALHAHPEVVAVGECGLDYFRDFSPRPAQRKAFERQLEIVFSSNRASADPFDQDIYVATRRSVRAKWGKPVRIANRHVNTPGSETRASLSADGTRLYFGRKLAPEDPGDVYVSTRRRKP